MSEEAPDSDSDSSDALTVSPLVREGSLALGLVVLLLGSMWISTGSFPPMVVVESGSMMHDEDGSVGAIDPGDLILVCLLYTSPSPRDGLLSRMPSSA